VCYIRDNKTQARAACVALNKNIGRRERKVDIIFTEDEKGAWSVRSVTELMNILTKWRVSFEERKRVFDFVAERLCGLAAEDAPVR